MATAAKKEPTIEELQAELEALRKASAEKDQAIEAMHADREGWLVTTPNAAFDGVIAGVAFSNGQAFIRKTQVVEAFNFKPEKQTTLDKYGYKPEEQAAIRQREKISSAQRAAEAFRDDYGYTVEWYGRERLAQLDAVRNARVAQRAQVEATLEAQHQLDLAAGRMPAGV